MDSKSNGETRGLGEVAQRVRADLGELRRAIAQGRQSLVTGVARFVQANPLMAVGVALGVGYVLGGGLFSRTTGRAVALGVRFGGAALVRDMLRGMSEELDEETTISGGPA